MGAPSGDVAVSSSIKTQPTPSFSKKKTTTQPPAPQKITLEELERTYASLIQQYLSVLCHENATFLAERMVASLPNSARAVYLLSMCHYRSGDYKRARTVLLLHGKGRGTGVGSGSGSEGSLLMGGTGGIGEEKENIEREDVNEDDEEGIHAAMKYLLAKCCLELKLYGEAEECLLGECREKFRTLCMNNNGNPTGMNHRKEMDEWILHATPCPIPNGAAGLNLLGTICRRSNRRSRAIDYYRLSLKLDPMMWTSYEALCEMGANDPTLDDPVSVFGVYPPMLQKSHHHYNQQQQQQHGNIVYEDQSHDNNGAGSTATSYRDHLSCSPGGLSVSVTPLGAAPPSATAAGVVDHHHGRGHHSIGGESVENVVGDGAPSFAVTPSTPFTSRMLDIDEERAYGGAGDVPPTTDTANQSHLPQTSLFNTGGGRGMAPSTAGRPPSASGGGGGNRQLFNTPDLTPIQRWGGDNTVGGAGSAGSAGRQQQHYASQHPPSSAKLHPSHYSGTEQQHGGGAAPTSTGPPDSARVASTHSAIARAVAGGGGPITSSSSTAFGRLSTSSYSTTSGNNVVARARQVAARLYYEPSPETTPPNIHPSGRLPAAMTSSLKIARGTRSISRRRLLSGLALLDHDHDHDGGHNHSLGMENDPNTTLGRSQSRLSFSSSSAGIVATPVLAKSSIMDDSESSIKVGKRALFMQSVDRAGDEGDDGESKRIVEGSVAKGESKDTEGENDGARADSGPEVPKNRAVTIGGGGSVGDFFLDGGDITPREDGGVQVILELLCTLGAAQKSLCQFRCREALQIFHQLPFAQFNTGWVQHQVGRAYFEMADYQNSKRALETMQRIEPHRMKGLEVLSTTLWHLKKEVELSDLAQRAVDFDRMAPESWCVVGNCFSLQKEHETALTFFRRSIQVDSSFTYSHTLSGHEYVSNEDFDKAVSCYRDAIRIDGCGRHYNAWYGLGAIYFRQEKYDLAEYHFQKALSINPQSSVLQCHVGMAQHANGKPYEALDTLEGAFRLDPQNAQARYQRATILMSLDRPEQALGELEKVRDAAPREASVHFAMGRVLKRLGRPEQAMRCFLTALDLDPKDNNLIKSAMDRLDEPDVEEDVSAF